MRGVCMCVTGPPAGGQCMACGAFGPPLPGPWPAPSAPRPYMPGPTVPAPRPLSEEDVRRIIREELDRGKAKT